jgi:hypothetical protein
MPILELKLYPPRESYTQVVLLYDKMHWSWHDGESARVALAYDPARGELRWWERTRSGPTGEWAKTSFVFAASAAANDPKIVDEMRRVTNRMKRRASARINELEAEGTPEALEPAGNLRSDLKGDWLRTTPVKASSRRRR